MRRKGRGADLFTELDDDIGIAAAYVADGEVDAALDADAEETEQAVHRRRLIPSSPAER